jgi:hypothetical protein
MEINKQTSCAKLSLHYLGCQQIRWRGGRLCLAGDECGLFCGWVPVVHHRFESGLNVTWFGRDVLIISMVATLVGYVLFTFMPQINSRLWLAGAVMGFGFLVMLAGACVSSVLLEKAKIWFEQ